MHQLCSFCYQESFDVEDLSKPFAQNREHNIHTEIKDIYRKTNTLLDPLRI